MDKYNFLDLAKERYSVRKFSGEPVGDKELSLILEAGKVAPTAANKQPQRVLVINEKEALAKVKLATRFLYDAPLAILISYDENECWVRDFDDANSGEVDASIVATHMMLEAAALGIGSTWVMWFDPDVIKREFEMPENIVPVALLITGYPSSDSKPSARHTEYKTDEELIFYNKF